MDFLTNEMLFYGGMIVAAGAAVLGVVVFCVFQVQKVRLNVRLDQEYGEKESRRK